MAALLRVPGRELLAKFGPQSLAGRPLEAAFFAAAAAVGLGLASVSAVLGKPALVYFDFLWVLAAAWLLPGGLSAAIVGVGMILSLVLGATGAVGAWVALSQALLLPIVALAGRAASVSILRTEESSALARTLSRHSERVAELENAKSEFLRIAAHELRGPIAVIRGYVSMMSDGSLGALPPGASHAMPVVEGKLREINHLVDQMLDTARLEDSRLQLVLQRRDVRDLVRDVHSSMQPLAQPQHRLELDMDRRRAVAAVDSGRVSIILTNLLQNAIKYSPDGGPITCRVRVEGGFVSVAVTDRGIGIGPREQERLFTPYTRVVAESRGISGTGLGLYISRELARKHGGDITLSSRPGSGSTFTLRIPLAPESSHRPGSAERRRSPAKQA